MNRIYSYAVVCLLFIFTGPVSAIPPDTIERDEFIVQYDKSLHTVAKEIVRIYTPVQRELEEMFETGIDFKPTIILIRDRKDFRKMVGSDLIVAVAIPQKNLIVIDNSKMKTHPFTLEVTLKHELCHLLLHHLVRGGRLPKWLNEGLSQRVTGGISEMIIGESEDLLKQAALSGNFIPMENLSEKFPADSRSLLLAYQQSNSFVGYIVREFGHRQILHLLNRLSSGSDVHTAVGEVFPVSLYTLETQWHDHLRTRYTWFTYLSSHLVQIVFSFGAVVLIYGFVKFLIKKRNYRDEEDDTDHQLKT